MSELLKSVPCGNGETVDLTSRFTDALSELMNAHLEMMRDAFPDQAEVWKKATCYVGDLSELGGLKFTFGGDKWHPVTGNGKTDIVRDEFDDYYFAVVDENCAIKRRKDESGEKHILSIFTSLHEAYHNSTKVEEETGFGFAPYKEYAIDTLNKIGDILGMGAEEQPAFISFSNKVLEMSNKDLKSFIKNYFKDVRVIPDIKKDQLFLALYREGKYSNYCLDPFYTEEVQPNIEIWVDSWLMELVGCFENGELVLEDGETYEFNQREMFHDMPGIDEENAEEVLQYLKSPEFKGIHRVHIKKECLELAVDSLLEAGVECLHPKGLAIKSAMEFEYE